MSIQDLFKTFRLRRDFTLEEEVALYRKRAGVALAEERYGDALVFLAKVLRLDPNDLPARLTVAETYHRHLHDRTKALVTYDKVIAAAGYDAANPFCAAAHEGIRELTSIISVPGTVEPEEETPSTVAKEFLAEGAGR